MVLLLLTAVFVLSFASLPCREVKTNTLFYLHFFGILSRYLAYHTYLQYTELRIVPLVMDARRKLEETYIDSSIISIFSTFFQWYCSQLRASHHLRHAAENRR